MIKIEVVIRMEASGERFRRIIELPILMPFMSLVIKVNGKSYPATIPMGNENDPLYCHWEEERDHITIGGSFSKLHVNNSVRYNGITTQDFLADQNWTKI